MFTCGTPQFGSQGGPDTEFVPIGGEGHALSGSTSAGAVAAATDRFRPER
ncbi:hypothetical protein ACPXCX_01675 [Streptomyces sp. DT225]